MQVISFFSDNSPVMTTIEPKTQEGKTRFLVSMPVFMKFQLESKGRANNRDRNAEIVYRLGQSLRQEAGSADGGKDVFSVQQEPGAYTAPVETTATERAMLKVFRALPPEKQLALLSLFK